MESIKNCLSRYKAGKFEAVWQELNNLGEVKDESIKNGASALGQEIMKRVKYNLNVIANNLIQLGFEFVEPEKVLVPAQLSCFRVS